MKYEIEITEGSSYSKPIIVISQRHPGRYLKTLQIDTPEEAEELSKLLRSSAKKLRKAEKEDEKGPCKHRGNLDIRDTETPFILFCKTCLEDIGERCDSCRRWKNWNCYCSTLQPGQTLPHYSQIP